MLLRRHKRSNCRRLVRTRYETASPEPPAHHHHRTPRRTQKIEMMPSPGAPILVIKPQWLKKILEGEKTLEIRSSACRKEIGTTVFFSPSGSGQITGCATFQSSTHVPSEDIWASLRLDHCVPGERPYRNTHAWRFCNAVTIEPPISYTVRPGTVVWRKYSPLS